MSYLKVFTDHKFRTLAVGFGCFLMLGFASPAFADYAAGIRNYCIAKSALPFTESLSTCTANARYNTKLYREALAQIELKLGDRVYVQKTLQWISRSMDSQLAWADWSLPGFNLKQVLGAADIQRTLDQAMNSSKRKRDPLLPSLIQHAKVQLRIAENHLK